MNRPLKKDMNSRNDSKSQIESKIERAANYHEKTNNTKLNKKNDTECSMIGLIKSFRKNRKKVKKNIKMPHVNKKSRVRNELLFKHVFSLYFKTRAEEFHTAKPHPFSLHCLIRRDQKHLMQKRLELDLKNYENERTDLKKT